MATPLRILLVDDHAVVRAGCKALLENQADLRVIAEADSGEAACRQFIKHTPDVVIMDLSMPGVGGIEAIRRIVSRQSDARVLVFSMHEDTLFVEQALQAGAGVRCDPPLGSAALCVNRRSGDGCAPERTSEDP